MNTSLAALGLDRVRKSQGRSILNPITTEGGHGGPPLQYVPHGANR